VTAAYIDQILDDVMMPLLGVARAPRRKKAARR
jgi:hypothetical protein